MAQADVAPVQDPRPPEWAGLLSEDEWGTAVRAVGCERLLELRSLMAEFTPGFRSHVVRQLAGLDGYPVGQKPLLAVARSVYDLEVEGCRAASCAIATSTLTR